MKNELLSRNPQNTIVPLNTAKVAVLGLGGLGSNIAVMLTRIGVDELLLIDFDKVEYSNLNRQYYFLDDVGKNKTEALTAILKKINPEIKLITKDVFLTADNVYDITKGYPIVCEAFDNPNSKADIVNALLEQGTQKIVAANGMAGYDKSNLIASKRLSKNLFVCGDGKPSPYGENIGLMAPRVNICAGHQANTVVRIIMGEYD